MSKSQWLRAVFCLGMATWLAQTCAAQDDSARGRPGAAGVTRQDRPRDGDLAEGVPAPDFRLKSLDGKQEVQLSSHHGRKPVVLIFGSYT